MSEQSGDEVGGRQPWEGQNRGVDLVRMQSVLLCAYPSYSHSLFFPFLPFKLNSVSGLERLELEVSPLP